MTNTAKPLEMKLEDLSPPARAAVEAKKLDGAWESHSLIRIIGELERWDNMAEARKASAKKFFILALVLLVIAFFSMFVLGAVLDQFVIGLILFLCSLVLLYFAVQRKKAAARLDLPNEIRNSLKPVFRQLHQDIHPGEKIKITLNLSCLDEKQAHTKKDLPASGRNRSVKESTYEQELCGVRFPLLDGTEAVLRLENTFVKLERSYKTSRGKYKSKTKWKKVSTATAMLLPPARLNWEPARTQSSLDPRFEKMSFVEKDGVMAARLDRYYKFKKLSDPPEDAVPAADIIRMFVQLTAMRPQPAGGHR